MSTGNGRLKWRQLSLRRDAGHNLATPPTFPRSRRPSTEARRQVPPRSSKLEKISVSIATDTNIFFLFSKTSSRFLTDAG